jgi:hypothetical protein
VPPAPGQAWLTEVCNYALGAISTLWFALGTETTVEVDWLEALTIALSPRRHGVARRDNLYMVSQGPTAEVALSSESVQHLDVSADTHLLVWDIPVLSDV